MHSKTFLIPDALAEALIEMAHKTRLSQATLVRHALSEYLREKARKYDHTKVHELLDYFDENNPAPEEDIFIKEKSVYE